jgi:hypothetical protein
MRVQTGHLHNGSVHEHQKGTTFVGVALVAVAVSVEPDDATFVIIAGDLS